MARTEVLDRRTANSKTFDNGDGTFTLEVGCHAHHKKDGAFVDTDVSWTDATDKFGTGEHPFSIAFAKSTRTLTIDFKNGDVITLTPSGARNPSSITKSGNTLTFVRLWTGITLTVTLMPEGINLAYTKTAEVFTNPAWAVTGPAEKYLKEERYDSPVVPLGYIPLDYTLANGILTLDMGVVPVGGTVK